MADSRLAAPELAAFEVEGMTRSSFILRGALAAGAVYGVEAVTPFVGQAIAQAGGGDAAILNFALTLEYLEADFYQRQGRQVKLSGEARKLARQFGDEEAQHVSALANAVSQLGATPAKKPKFHFPVTNQASFLKLAHTLEETGVGAYNGAGPALQSKQLLGTAGTIVQIEARHAAAISILVHKPPAPTAFDKPLGMAKVLKAVKPLIKA